jgi:hypothetical protein
VQFQEELNYAPYKGGLRSDICYVKTLCVASCMVQAHQCEAENHKAKDEAQVVGIVDGGNEHGCQY